MDRESVKRALIAMIDENPDVEVKARFYSDEVVSSIMNSLYEKWEASGGQGIPLDYASDEELRVLYDRARRYAGSSGSSLLGLLKRVLGG
ncbi:MAG: hypothetical protein QXS85_00340 [Acidilobaceae archaeon]